MHFLDCKKLCDCKMLNTISLFTESTLTPDTVRYRNVCLKISALVGGGMCIRLHGCCCTLLSLNIQSIYFMMPEMHITLFEPVFIIPDYFLKAAYICAKAKHFSFFYWSLWVYILIHTLIRVCQTRYEIIYICWQGVFTTLTKTKLYIPLLLL